MSQFTIEELQSIAREIIGDREIVLAPEMTAVDVPGWDSLNHTLISLEIGGRLGCEIDPQQLAQAATFGEVIEIVNTELESTGQSSEFTTR